MNDSRPTVEDVARSALAAVDLEINVVLAAQWVTERYANIAARTTLRALHRQGTISIPAVVQAGTVTATSGSDVVIGDATAAAAWGAELVGRQIQLYTNWYTILAVTGTEVQLEQPYVEDDVTAGSYTIVQRYFTLEPNARTLGDFVLPQRRLRLRKMSLADLDYFAPYRQRISYGPTCVVDFGVSPNGHRLVELYPYPSTAMQVRYDYWAEPPRLELTDQLPGSVDLHMLKEGVLIDVYRHCAARYAKPGGDPNLAAFYRNESRAQETRWETFVAQALLNDRGLDDIETRMRSSLGGTIQTDIVSAYDEIWSRGLRP